MAHDGLIVDDRARSDRTNVEYSQSTRFAFDGSKDRLLIWVGQSRETVVER